MPEHAAMTAETWTLLVNEYEPLIGRIFFTETGRLYRFFGLVHADDDFYYGMVSIGKILPTELRLLSCVGDLESHGFTLEEDDDV
jgi:hypothetical protein